MTTATLSAEQRAYAEEILSRQRDRDRLWFEIEALTKKVIPDYHFLDYRVSTFWTCSESPVGMCVFKLDDHGHATECRYCGDPPERK